MPGWEEITIVLFLQASFTHSLARFIQDASCTLMVLLFLLLCGLRRHWLHLMRRVFMSSIV